MNYQLAILVQIELPEWQKIEPDMRALVSNIHTAVDGLIGDSEALVTVSTCINETGEPHEQR